MKNKKKSTSTESNETEREAVENQKEATFPVDYTSHQRQSYDKPYRDMKENTGGSGYEEYLGNGVRTEDEMAIKTSIDEDAQKKIECELATIELGQSDLEIEVNDGIVYLNGSIEKESSRKAIYAKIEKLKEIKDIQDNLVVTK